MLMHIDANWLVDRLSLLIPLWLSLSVHEWAHAWAAWKLGDDTARLAGRLTLNPLAHVDPIGTLLLPLIGVPFGWAKPVPVQPHRFHAGMNMRTGMLLTAVAGPLANLALLAVCLVLFALMIRFQPSAVTAEHGVGVLVGQMIFLNVVLAVFNALPIPPLDGSRVADALMPDVLRPGWEEFCRFGPFALAAVIILPVVSGIHLFRWPLEATMYVLQQLVMLLGG
jgi:Zn-dependent protease